MKILALVGSGRRHGNSARIVELIERAFRAEALTRHKDVEWETIFLPGLNLQYCRGCRACFNHGEDHCPNKDGLLELRDAVARADGVVLASPVYVNDVSGSVKTLIDRLGFVCHRPQFMKTPFLLLATTGGTTARHAIRTLQSAAVSWGAPLGASAAFATGALSGNDEIASHSVQANRAARKFLSRIEQQLRERPSFLSLLVFAIQQRAWRRHWAASPSNTLDHRYWKDAGWLDRDTTYFFAHRAPIFRVIAARGVAAIVARFTS